MFRLQKLSQNLELCVQCKNKINFKIEFFEKTFCKFVSKQLRNWKGTVGDG